jgi:hypothetical protein
MPENWAGANPLPAPKRPLLDSGDGKLRLRRGPARLGSHQPETHTQNPECRDQAETCGCRACTNQRCQIYEIHHAVPNLPFLKKRFANAIIIVMRAFDDCRRKSGQ